MTKYQENIAQTIAFFQNKDIDLGFRKLLDCIIDTQNIELYKKGIDLTEWKEKNPQSIDELCDRSIQLLKDISNENVQEIERKDFVLKAENIKKSYGANRFKMGPVSVQIKKGEVYGLVGENGNGKTTLLRILAKELSHDTGKLTYQFKNNPKSDYDLNTKLVYIPQRTEKWYGSLKDNLKFVLSNYKIAPEENETRVLMMIARLGLWNYKHLKWSELSSGYKMRFELARTLLRQPEILLLDEPLANLDVVAQQVILEDLKAISNSISNPIALILSSQQLYEVEKVSDKVIFLKNGEYKEDLVENGEEEAPLIIELDAEISREELLRVMDGLSMEKLNYNGGVFVIYFTENIGISEVLQRLATHKVALTYLRDITKSTRRFFVKN